MEKLELVIDQIIECSPGSLELYYPEEYYDLSDSEKAEVKEVIEKHLDYCGDCGFIEEIHGMYLEMDGATICDTCYELRRKDEEDE
jgi:hypothetical protein